MDVMIENLDMTSDAMILDHWLEGRGTSATDPGLLLQIYENYRQAIRQDYEAAGPYFRMSWLLWLLGESEWAHVLLHKALSLDPGHSEGLILLRLVQRAREMNKGPLKAVPLFSDSEVIDPARLITDILRTRINQALESISARKPDWARISTERSRIEQLEAQYVELSQLVESIRLPLQTCAGLIDCSSLLERLQPLEAALAHYRDQLSQSWQMVELQGLIAAHNDWLDREVVRLDENRASLKALFSVERFDYLIDDCSDLAAQLEALELSGFEVRTLLGEYDAMAGKVSRILDLLDEEANGQ